MIDDEGYHYYSCLEYTAILRQHETQNTHVAVNAKASVDWRMTYEDFVASANSPKPPEGVSNLLKALWWDKNGDWDHAHRIAQQDPSEPGSAVHAFLHREEGDIANARYWYERAGRQPRTDAIEAEWSELVRELV